MTLDSLSSKVSMIHVQSACRSSKKPGPVRTTGLLTTKSHYIALLVDWVSKLSLFKGTHR